MACDRVRSSFRPHCAALIEAAGRYGDQRIRSKSLQRAYCTEYCPGFPNPDLFDHCAHSGRRLLTPYQKFRQHGRIAHIAGGELGRPDLQCLLVNSDVDLAPYTAFGAAMFARSSGKQSPGLFSHPPQHCSRAGGRVYRSVRPPRSWQARTRSSASPGA